jgi:hypothetical protein
MDERRAAPRIRMRRKLGIVLSNGNVVHAWTRDLSMSGIQLLTEYSADEGDDFTLFMHLPQGDSEEYAYVEMRCRVVHLVYDGPDGCYRIGFHILGFRDGSKRVYQAFINAHLGTALEEPGAL